MLKLGGLENSAPKTDQSPNKFKIANNVTFTEQGELTPRPSMEGFTGNIGPYGSYDCIRWDLFTSYGSGQTTRDILKWGTVGETFFSNGYKYLWKGNTVVPFFSTQGVALGSLTSYSNNFSCQSVEINNTKYILDEPNTSRSGLYKYAGYEVYPTGVGLPYATAFGADYSQFILPSTSTSGTFVKVLQNTLDMAGTNVTGNPIQFNIRKTYAGIGKTAVGLDTLGNKIVVGEFSYSYDGINWDANSFFPNVYNNLTDTPVAYGLVSTVPTFVRIGVTNNPYTSTVSCRVQISNDGKIWQTYYPSTLTGGFVSCTNVDIAYGNGTFIAINDSGIAASSIATSTDGINWTLVTSLLGTNPLSCIHYSLTGGVPTFVVLPTTGTNYLYFQTVWATRTLPASHYWTGITRGEDGIWVAVNNTGTTTTTQLMTNPDPSTTAWTFRTIPAVASWTGIVSGRDSAGTSRYYASAFNTNALITSTSPTATWTTVLLSAAPLTSNITLGHFPNQTTSTGTFFAAGNVSGLVSRYYATTTTWTETDNVQICELELANSFATYNNFLQETSNPSYFENTQNFDPYFIGTITYNSSTTLFESPISTAKSNLDSGCVGIWLIRPLSFSQQLSGRILSVSAVAYQVETASAPSITFNKTVKLYDNSSLQWIDCDVSSIPSIIPKLSGVIFASRTFYTVWASSSANGIYYYKGVSCASPALETYSSINASYVFYANISYPTQENKVQKAASLPFSMSGALNDWYAVESFKTSFNEILSQDPGISITTYLGQLLIASSQTIYISDSTLGGSLEMTEGLASVVIGNSEDGNITSILGTEDYLIVSREKKVYLVTGSLVTGQYRAQQIFNISVGAYSNTCLLAVEGGALLLSSSGVWFIDGPNATLVSKDIPLNFRSFFKSYTPFHPSEEQNALVFNMNNYPITAWTEPNTKKYITSCFDPNRKLAIFTTSETGKAGNSLVLHLLNKEWTTWNSYDENGYETSAMTAFDGKIYVGTINPAGNSGLGLARTASEITTPSTYTYDYLSRSAPRLVTTWMTAGEPSLDKLLLQLKIFGYIRTALDIKHYANWSITTAVTSAVYTPSSNYLFFHKQRLTSSKQMAVAIEIALRASGETFWIEGLEVEFEPIQVGMKR